MDIYNRPSSRRQFVLKLGVVGQGLKTGGRMQGLNVQQTEARTCRPIQHWIEGTP